MFFSKITSDDFSCYVTSAVDDAEHKTNKRFPFTKAITYSGDLNNDETKA